MTSISKRTIAVLMALIVLPVFFQSWGHAEVVAEVIPFDSPRWVLPEGAAKVTDHLGRKSLRLQGGMAYLKDVEFTDGIIEYDVAFSKKRGFFGAVFRVQDDGNFEEFYMRSHQSGNPDALQYTPVYNHMSAWQLYHGPGLSGTTTYKFDQWMHIKLVVSGKQAELYIDNMEQPVLFMNHLRRPVQAGKVGLQVNRFAPGHYSNYSVVKMDKPLLKSKQKAPQATPPGTVMAWHISTSFPEARLKQVLQLTDKQKDKLQWQSLKSESSGLANISRLTKYHRQNNTVFARLTIDSATQQLKVLRLGFSDRVKVYLNGKLLYTGQNNYRSRDYRYLGTIGYFDGLALALEKGRNELWLGVSENFGGWGIKGRFDDTKGITIE